MQLYKHNYEIVKKYVNNFGYKIEMILFVYNILYS